MGTDHSVVLKHRRPRWRAYLLLARVSNLPTVWTNVVAGAVLSGASLEWMPLAGLSAAVSLLYVAGMFLNDAFDHRIDAAVRPERPLPAGDISLFEASALGAALLAAGTAALWWAGPTSTLIWGATLAAAIVYYDYHHKQAVFGPLIMGICRGLVYCVAASALGSVSPAVLAGAAVITAYVIGLTVVAKRLGARAGSIVPRLIAGISLVDAALVATVSLAAAPFVALGFFLTLAAQRFVPGD